MLSRLSASAVVRQSLLHNNNMIVMTQMRFIGKTESPHKFKQPTLRMKNVRRIFPPPGLDLKIPEDLEPEAFLKSIGGDCDEYADKFETMKDVMEMSSLKMKHEGVPTIQRKYILRCREQLRRGILTFEYLGRRTCLEPVKGRQ